jgi:hypothetical protein
MNNHEDFYISYLPIHKQLWMISNAKSYPTKIDTPYLKKCYNKCIENVLMTLNEDNSTELYSHIMLLIYKY